MKVLIYKIALIYLLSQMVSCHPKTSDNSSLQMTEYEKVALKQVSDFFGGTCVGSYGVDMEAQETKGSFFQIEIIGSPVHSRYKSYSDVIGTNAALIFVTNIQDSLLAKYSYIEVSFEDTKTQELFRYDMTTLDSLSSYVGFVHEVVTLLYQKRYGDLLNLSFNSSDSMNQLTEYALGSFEERIGDIREFRLLGFRKKVLGEKNFVKVFGILIGEKDNCHITLLLPQNEPMSLFELNYSLSGEK